MRFKKSVWEIMSEELDIKKLHDPAEFTKEAEEFARETNAQLAALMHFAQDKKLPALEQAITEAQKGFSKLESVMKEVANQMRAHAVVNDKGNSGKTFK